MGEKAARIKGAFGIMNLTEEEKEIFEERAAIREFDGNVSREEAEAGALEDIIKIRERTHV